MSSSGLLLIFAAPSGGGKGTIIKRLLLAHPDWGFSISATTRKPRPGETDGREYYFLSHEEFERRIGAGDFLEHENVHGDWYGTLRAPTQERLARGETILFDVDVKGALNLKEAFPEALSLFILPPSREILRQRLTGRGTEPPDVVERRLMRADMELDLAPRFDVRVVNDELERAITEVETEIASYRERSKHDSH